MSLSGNLEGEVIKDRGRGYGPISPGIFGGLGTGLKSC